MPGARSMMAWGQGGQAGPPRKIKADTLKRIAKSFSPYRVKVYWTLLMVVAVVFLNVLPNWFLRIISDDGFLKNDLGVVARYSIYSLIAVVLLSVLTFAYGYISGDIGQRIMRDFRNQLFTHLQGMSLRFFTSSRTGEVQSRLLSDVAGVQNVVSDVVTNALANIGVVLASIAGMILLDWRLSLLAVGIIPIFAYLSNLAGEYARKTRRKTQQQTAEMNALMQETLSVSGILLTKTSGRRSLVQSKFSKENQGLADLQLRLQMVQYFFFGLTRMIFQITPALAYWLAAYLLDSKGQHITIGTLIAFTGFQARMLFPLSAILSVQVELTSSLALFDRIYEYLDMPQDIVDKPEAIELAPHDVKGKVEFDSVGFRYDPSSATETLKNINFTAESGTLTALVGPSGAGKTTLTYLIARLYDVDSGCVKIDGHDVRDLKLACIEQFVGAVTQETYLVHDTIRENLRYANPDATDDQIIEATKAAAIHDHIANLPEGYDTVVGERGYKLSGGEKQRMAIARAILKNPRILILDEATSALDTQSERTIQTSLNRLMVGRTTFAIAHRLSTILAADQILVVSGGEIVQRGRHEELVAVPGLYQHLYNEQFASIPAQTPSDLNAPELSTP